MEPTSSLQPPRSVPASHRRFWTLGSAATLAALVVVGGTGAADRVYTALGRYNLLIVGVVASAVAVSAWRRGRRTGDGDRTSGAA